MRNSRFVSANAHAAGAVEGAGFEVLNELGNGNVLLVKGPDDAVDTLENERGVTAAARDIEVELDPVIEANHEPLPDDPDELYEEVQWDKQVQDVREAQEHATGAGQTIAVIDSGIYDAHPDLNVDVENSVAVIEGQLEDHIGDPNGHGTHVAGTAAGTGDALMTGTAPDATLVSVDVLGYGTGSMGDIMLGMEYAADVGADAANISLGFMMAPQDFAEFDDNVGLYRQMFEPVANHGQRDGTLYVGSGGNDETNLQGGWLRLWNGLSGVIGVSATTPDDGLAYYSNYGTNDIDVGAPGGGYETEEETVIEDPDEVEWPYPLNLVFSTYPGEEEDPANYAWLAGTSMAAPQVVGLAALVGELDSNANPQQVVQAIKQGAEGVNGRGSPTLGAGRVNALNTVNRVR